MKPLFDQVGIVGVGLIGGSLALDIRRQKLAKKVVGFGRNPSRLRLAKSRGLIDRIEPTLSRLIRSSDCIILCAPIHAMMEQLKAVAKYAKSYTVIMDVGSTKGVIVKEASKIFPKNVFFVGAHPMAGKEKGGPMQAENNFFKGKNCFIVPLPQTPSSVLSRVKKFWRTLGAKILVVDPATHDRFVTAVSHLPQISSYALVATASSLVSPTSIQKAKGRGWEDTTRLSASPPEIWIDICKTNAQNINRALKRYGKELKAMQGMIQNKKWKMLRGYFERARKIKCLLTP